MNYIKTITLYLTGVLAFSGNAFAEIRYVNATIERVEVCDSAGGTISAYLTSTSGDTPSTSDGCSNNIQLPFVRIAQSNTEFNAKSVMVSIALTAFSTGKTVRIRYDDALSNRVISLAILK